MNARRILTLAICVLFISLACMTTARLEEVGTAAPSTALSPTEGTPFEHPADETFQIPDDWAEPRGYHLCAIVTASQSLHLRSEPNENAQVIEWLLSGEQVKVYDPTGDFWGVETMSGKKGYAKARYLEAGECQ